MRHPRLRSLSAPVLLVLVAALILYAATRLLGFAIEGETNADLLVSALHPCESTPIATTSKMALIRLDDVQAFAWAQVSTRLMDDARERGIPLVLGVIPHGIEDDRTMYEYLRQHRCFHEIAQHGWDHGMETQGEVPEFRDAGYDEAHADITRGRRILETLARERLTAFIPPNNEMSPDAYRAVEEAGIPVVSSAGVGRFDFHATTFDYRDDVITSAPEVLSDCAARTEAHDLCVVMVHPQDFTTAGGIDEAKYRIYLDVLDGLAREGYTFVRFRDLIDFDRTYAPWERFLIPSVIDALSS